MPYYYRCVKRVHKIFPPDFKKIYGNGSQVEEKFCLLSY